MFKKYFYLKNNKALILFVSIFVGVVSLINAAQINTNGKLEIAADDYSFSARITGRLHVDGNFYRSGSDRRKLPSGTFVRRARIGVRGNFRAWEYRVDLDNATDTPDLRGAYIRRLIGPGKFSIGQFKVFESISEMTSSNHTTFIERAFVGHIVPGMKIGVAYNGSTGHFGYSGSIYNARKASDGEARPTNAGVGGVLRGFYAPVHEKTTAVHFGASYAYEATDSSGTRVRISPLGRAEEFKDGREFRFNIYDRRDRHVKVDRIIFETAAVNGPLSIQAEYLFGQAKANKMTDDSFRVWYVELSYVLTGEAKEYDLKRGRIESLEPEREMGAFEISARHQRAEREKINQAELSATEFGLTYYANANVRFLVNYGWSHNKLIDDKPRLLSTRAQFNF
ncbi:MAG: OprO/OprP family phosphate-selective porin [Elusimicrobiota bacterium]